MLARKVIKAKILELRRDKSIVLERECRSYQRYLHGDKTVSLYSATRQQADRYLGELTGIRADMRGRSWKRRLSNFPFYRFHRFIKYRAEWLGIRVMQVSEAYTF